MCSFSPYVSVLAIKLPIEFGAGAHKLARFGFELLLTERLAILGVTTVRSIVALAIFALAGAVGAARCANSCVSRFVFFLAVPIAVSTEKM